MKLHFETTIAEFTFEQVLLLIIIEKEQTFSTKVNPY